MRVALVDSSRTMLKYVARLLEARDHDVSSFGDPGDALDYLRSDASVDALITSAELTTMTGMELCWEVRLLANDRRPIYVLFMSASGDRHKLSEVLDSGADDFISKPPKPDELYARLRAAERLNAIQHDLIRLCTRDPLTGLLNRRGFFEQAHEVCNKPGPISAIMLDIDKFKSINDLHGHDIGDRVICAVANGAASEGSIVGRLGGEEFAILLKGKHLADSVGVAERLRKAVESLQVATDSGFLALTCSFGVAERQLDEAPDALLKRADLALYIAKTRGRNRVVADTEEPEALEIPSSIVRSVPRGQERSR